MAWLSPGFPIGSFGFSHGLEAAAASRAVRGRESLELWISAIVASGGGRIDADILRDAYRASAGGYPSADGATRRGVAFRVTGETRLETTAQGEAFLTTCRAAWPNSVLDCWAEGEAVCYPTAVGAATAQVGIPLDSALLRIFAGVDIQSGFCRLALRNYRANRCLSLTALYARAS